MTVRLSGVNLRSRARSLPELPDLVVYLDALRRCVLGRRLDRIRVVSPFVLRSVDPPLESISGAPIIAIDRIGKRLVFGFPGDRFLVVHLMIAGRLRWIVAGAEKAKPRRPSPRIVLAAFELEHGTLFFTEASSRKRASMQMASGAAAVRALDPGGVEPLEVTLADFQEALTRESHTVKRALTDPHLVSGIGNAYSDEILWAAKISPVRLTQKMNRDELTRLYECTQSTLREWTERLMRETGDEFPEKVTAFRAEMAVHGQYKKPCPRCGAPVQRIAYADNEANYCARCQTGGKLLADRGLSRLLHGDWPKTLDELELRLKRAPSKGDS
jgi:formamidopyrimidine-DNA glycosylase